MSEDCFVLLFTSAVSSLHQCVVYLTCLLRNVDGIRMPVLNYTRYSIFGPHRDEPFHRCPLNRSTKTNTQNKPHQPPTKNTNSASLPPQTNQSLPTTYVIRVLPPLLHPLLHPIGITEPLYLPPPPSCTYLPTSLCTSVSSPSSRSVPSASPTRIYLVCFSSSERGTAPSHTMEGSTEVLFFFFFFFGAVLSWTTTQPKSPCSQWRLQRKKHVGIGNTTPPPHVPVPCLFGGGDGWEMLGTGRTGMVCWLPAGVLHNRRKL